jgi:hypothetical protein
MPAQPDGAQPARYDYLVIMKLVHDPQQEVVNNDKQTHDSFLVALWFYLGIAIVIAMALARENIGQAAVIRMSPKTISSGK